jgi:hypothetical protein
MTGATSDGTSRPYTDGTKQIEHPGKPEGIIALANAIPDIGAISSVNLLKNEIDVEQAEDLVSILKEHPALKSLCGNKGDEAELDMSGKMSGAGDAIMLATEIVGNGSLTKLDISNNNIEQGQALRHITECCSTKGIELASSRTSSGPAAATPQRRIPTE